MRFLYHRGDSLRVSPALSSQHTHRAYVSPVWRPVNNWTVSVSSAEYQGWIEEDGGRHWCSARSRLECGYKDLILLACNSPLQCREKKDRQALILIKDVIIQHFIVIIYRDTFRNITTPQASRSYISINHSKLLPTTKLQSALQLSMQTFTLEGFLVDLLSIKNPKQIVEITDFILLDWDNYVLLFTSSFSG